MLARVVACAIVLATTAVAGQVRHPVPLLDPAHDLVRIELRLITVARFASVRVQGPVFVQGSGQRATGPAALGTAVADNLLSLSGNVEGEPAAGVFRCILAQVTLASSIDWQLNVQAPHRATIEIYNMNDESRPRLVDRFEGATGDVFSTSASNARMGGPLPVQPPPERLVLGFYFPWYDRVTWADSQLLDQPLRLYSTEDSADLLRELQDARRAGLDGVIVSFQGKEIGGGWNHRRMLLILQAAQQAGLRVSVQTETLAAHLPDRPGPPHVDTLTVWLTDIVDSYGAHPAYLRVDGRPVVFVYVWFVVDDAVWAQALGRVRASGRQLFVVADSVDPGALELADSLYTFGGNLFAADIQRYSQRHSLMTRSFHLLGADRARQRLGIVTVSPGYDESGLRDRSAPHLVVDRQGGEYYVAQWRAAVDSGADWVLVSTWNEWWENTHIEPSQRYGESYLWRTRFWSAVFKTSPRVDPTTR
jgi:hypothetical protein